MRNLTIVLLCLGTCFVHAKGLSEPLLDLQERLRALAETEPAHRAALEYLTETVIPEEIELQESEETDER